MKKKILIVGAFLLLLLGILSWGLWQYREEKTEDETSNKIYYVNTQATSLKAAPYSGELIHTVPAIEEMLDALKKQNDIELLPAIPENVKVLDYEMEHGKLDLHFNSAYLWMDPAREVMCRAAVVCSLTQINGVNEVMFYVGEEPLTNKDGKSYGYMQDDEFVQNTGSAINSYEKAEIVLYFSNEDGNALVEEVVEVRCNSSQSRESAVVECLMKGPESYGLQSTIPKGTKLFSASINEGICYLNFNEGLNNSIPGVNPEVVIYSIVNTVIECGNVGMVQIAINGESNLVFQGCVELGEPLSRNLDVVEERPLEEKKTDSAEYSMDHNRVVVPSELK